MALEYTTEITLGYQAPNFDLLNVLTGKKESFNDLKGSKGTVVIFMCNHCPYVIHILDELIKIGEDYKSKGINLIGINSNDVQKYVEDSPENMKVLAKLKKLSFPYLFDETQEVAKAYDAVCTPDFSVFDEEDKCVYRGRMDQATPGNYEPITGVDLRNTLDLLLENKIIPKQQFPSCGCSIKWK